MNIMYGKVRINGEAGQTITITTPKGTTQIVQTTGQDFTDIVLAGMEEYTLSNGQKNRNVLLNVGDFKEIDISKPQDLEEATWQEISDTIADGTFSQYASVGDTKSFEIGGKTYHAEVVAINGGTGDAAQWYPNKTVDFICTELYETAYRYSSSATNSGGFPSSEIKNTLNNTIYPLLPTDLKNVIIDKSHSYQAGSRGSSSWSSSMQTLSTKLWLPTYYEIAGTSATYTVGETSSNNKAYTLASMIKMLNGATSASHWWLGSPYTNNTTNIWHVYTDGHITASGVSNVLGVPICFRIGGDN